MKRQMSGKFPENSKCIVWVDLPTFRIKNLLNVVIRINIPCVWPPPKFQGPPVGEPHKPSFPAPKNLPWPIDPMGMDSKGYSTFDLQHREVHPKPGDLQADDKMTFEVKVII